MSWLDRGVHPMTELRSVDLQLCFDSEAGVRELLFGPEDFGGRTHLGSLDRDRRIGCQFGAFAFGAGLRMAIVRRLTSPPPQDRRQ